MRYRSGPRDVLVACAAALLTLAAITIYVARTSEPATLAAPGASTTTPPAAPAPTITPTAVPAAVPAPAPKPPPPVNLKGTAAVVSKRPTTVRAAPAGDAQPISIIRPGIMFPVTEDRGEFLSVLTPCENWGWVHHSDVELLRKDEAPATKIEDATIVIDAGHGGQQPGAIGPTGLTEKELNLDVAKRLAGKIGSDRVFLTRSSDHNAGLQYRYELANRLGADLFISVHHNSVPDGPSSAPGTETYYQVASENSKRLGGLLFAEIKTALAKHQIAWVSDKDAGAKYRTNVRGENFFALLRGAQMPTVLTEAAFISNAPEEALLRQESVREDEANAILRGIERYLQTQDPGTGYVPPMDRTGGNSGRLPGVCVEPN